VKSGGFKKDIEIDWSEIDAYQHVNNLTYFKYVQSARVDLCAQAGIAISSQSTRPGFMVARTECDFKAALNYPGAVEVVSRITEIGESSFQIAHLIFDQTGMIAAELKDVLVLFDFATNKKVAISDELREKLIGFR